MTYKVAVWGTGNVGRFAVRAVAHHPELELAAVWVHSPEKVGKDAGDLAGLDRTLGVAATGDADAILASDIDCVVYCATSEVRLMEAAEDLVRILAAGKNVVASSPVTLVHPKQMGDHLAQRLADACEQGNASLFVTGIDPGWANDLLPLTLSGVSERIDRVHMRETINYATYSQPETIFEVMGFGKALDAQPLLLNPGMLQLAWGGTIKLVAEGLGVELDEIREVHERVAADFPIETTGGVIEPGTTAGLRFEVQGIVSGEPKIIVEHVTRMHDDVAPEWPSGHGYSVTIEGTPKLHLELTMEDDTGDVAVGGVILTATRLVNCIPAVCRAPARPLTPLDLPHVTGRGLLS
ncbi:MAG: Gfo/Idh/MocA family oxidoreductase [Myxococcota bacterium]